jgi:carotenoid cleavage dioxygenase
MTHSDSELRESLARWLSPASTEDRYTVTDVVGEVPREIHGTLYRNAPNQNVAPAAGVRAMHLFDGDGRVDAFRFEDGRVTHSNAFVRNASFLAEEKRGAYCMPGVVLPADVESDAPEIQGRVQHNTNVVHHGGRLLALVENAAPFELDPDTLEPIGPFDLQGRMLSYSTSAHPKVDGRSGELWIHGYAPFPPFVQLYALDADGNVTFAEPVEMPFATMMHDFAITEHHVIFPLCPIVIDFSVMETGGRFAEALRWEPMRGTRFGVRSRAADAPVRWFEAPTPGYLFHPGNAYEDGDRIHLDACVYRDGSALLEGLRTLRSGRVDPGFHAEPVAYELDLTSGDCRERVIESVGAEFPRCDDRRVGYPNRFGYAVLSHEGGPVSAADYFGNLIKYERGGGGSVVHRLPRGWRIGEPVFVPRHAGAQEDDGFVLAVAYDPTEDASELRILDARRFGGDPLARVKLRHRVPGGFHGNFAPGV